MISNEIRPYGRIDDQKLIEGLANGLSKTEAGLLAGSKAQRKNIPDIVGKKTENAEFKDKLEEHISLLQKYITEEKIAEEDVKSLVWMLDKLYKILLVSKAPEVDESRLPVPILEGLIRGLSEDQLKESDI